MLADAHISNLSYLWWNRPAIRILNTMANSFSRDLLYDHDHAGSTCFMIKQPWLEHAAAMPVIKLRSNPCNMSWEQFCFKICAQRIEKKTRTQRSALNHLHGKPSNFGPGENSNETVHSVKYFRKKKGNTFRGNYLFLASTSSRNFLQYHFSTKLKTSANFREESISWRIRVNES